MTESALGDVLRHAASVRVEEIDGYGQVVVDRPEALDGLRAAMEVSALPGHVCACRGQVRFEFFDAEAELLTVVVLHHGIALDWEGYSGHAELADGTALDRWLGEHGLSWRYESERVWVEAMPPALRDMADDLIGHFALPDDSRHLVAARERLRGVEPVAGVLQVLAWAAAGIGSWDRYPPYEDVPGQILREVPITEIIAALQDPRADERHDAGAARILLCGKSRIKQRLDVARLPGPLRARVRDAAAGRVLPKWAERLLLNA
ncbi:hypothetical protein SAMN05216553_102490 [Lentzea fradiae]|uniref:Uncharacterized protein n=1 Tax=Lentzea fradiae TaxID=200378 RepID=A0A1G7MSN6_9PSEU|nr:hypothetical protein [Lentzea fradiae]SDF64848.1 hypothetical protein SAMN05216553_102490 [Lentzea fradiae]